MPCNFDSAFHRVTGVAGDIESIVLVCEMEGGQDLGLEDAVVASQCSALGNIEIPTELGSKTRAGHHRCAGHGNRLFVSLVACDDNFRTRRRIWENK